MKMKNILASKFNIPAGLALTLAAAVWLTGAGCATQTEAGVGMKPMKGGEHLVMLTQVNTPAQAEDLQPGDSITMSCAKCKSVMIHYVNTEKGHIKTMTVGEKHLCPGCNTTIEVVGTGRGKHDQVKHVCTACGDDSVFCCATKPGTGATTGMGAK